MICPEGYFTPQMLEARFEKALSSDRVFPQIFTSAGGNFDRVPSRERTEVIRVSSVLFAQRFVELNRGDLLVYCPSRPAPLKVDKWLLRTDTKFPNTLPENAMDAKTALARTNKLYPLLSIEEWSVDYCSVGKIHFDLSKAEINCLEIIDGWSLCFSDSKLPSDIGQSINIIAVQMARDASADGIKKRGPGRTRKVDSVVERLKTLYPNGIPDKTAKQIQRDLSSAGQINFSMATLRKALNQIKNSNVTTT